METERKQQTTKEKAEQLIRKYYTWGINKEGQTLSWLEAKQCALIAVDEIIKTDMLIDEDTFVETPSYLQYWKGVKEEIKKL